MGLLSSGLQKSFQKDQLRRMERILVDYTRALKMPQNLAGWGNDQVRLIKHCMRTSERADSINPTQSPRVMLGESKVTMSLAAKSSLPAHPGVS